MPKLRRRSRTVRVAITPAALLLVLAGCGGSDSTVTPASSATGSPGAQGGPGGGPGGGADFAAIQACLKAAGIAVPTPNGSARPSGGARPSGTDVPRPSGSARPSGGRGGGFGGGGMFESAEAQAALKACGLTVPTGRGNAPGPSGTAAPTATT